MTRFVFLLVAALLSGCVAFQLTPQQAGQIRTIGVISIMGPMRLEYAPSFLQRSHAIFARGDELSMDSFVVRQVTEQLRARYDVRPVGYDPVKLAPRASWQLTGTVELDRPPDITPLLSQGFDAFVVVRPSTIQEPGSTLVRQVKYQGIGLVQFERPLSDKAFAVHAPYQVLVLDGKTGGQIASQFGDSGALWRAVDESWWADSFDAMSSQQKQQLREAIEQMIEKTLPSMLARAKLIPEQASSVAK